MFVVYLLWVTFVAGGLFMGIAAILFMQENGFSFAVLLNAVLYLGIAIYGLPKLYKFVFKKRVSAMPDINIFGINVIEVSFRWLHASMVAGWLLFDFLVYWLHFDVKNPAVPLEARLERAKIMHGIDRIVAYIFILTLPVGIILCYLTDNAPFSSTWLTWKHVLYAVIVVDGLCLIPISGTAVRNLKAIKDGAENVDELNHEIKHHMNIAMPAVFVVWALVIAISVLTLLNLKQPEDQEYFFRDASVVTTVEQDRS